MIMEIRKIFRDREILEQNLLHILHYEIEKEQKLKVISKPKFVYPVTI